MSDFEGMHTLRRNHVVKDNRLIQHSRHQFSLQQQKILLYIVSQLDSVNQTDFIEQTFDIREFCRACEINFSGKNYKDLKDAIIGIKNKGFWIKKDNVEVTVSWIAKAKIYSSKGQIVIKLDEDMTPYLLDLKAKFTKYQLIYTLTMRSKYAVRLYELLKSYETLEVVSFDIPRFKMLVDAGYNSWGELNRRVIQPAVNEINEVSDIQVRYEGVRGNGRSFVDVKFWIESKTKFTDKTDTERAIYNRLTGKKTNAKTQIEGQITLD